MSVKSLVNFATQVRSEAVKVSWPSKREVWTATLVVFFLTFITSIIFFVFDTIVARIIALVLTIEA